ncbi:MAG TPA: serine/threonine-protein kinase [Drouetiella sp.]
MSDYELALKNKLKLKEICGTCGQPVAETKRTGTITGWIFEDNYKALADKWVCQCGKADAAPQTDLHADQATKFGLAGASKPDAPILPSKISTRDMAKPDFSESGKAMQSFSVPSSEKRKSAEAAFKQLQTAKAPASKAPSPPPEVVAGKWRIVAPLGFGQLGETYTALSIENNKEVVVKIMDRNIAANPRIGKRFLQECEKAAALQHKNIIEILDFGRLPDGTPYVVSEHGDHTLASVIQREGFLDVADALRVADEICSGLIEAHNYEIIHRGLKPENVIISTENQAKLSDIGVAKALPVAGREAQNLTATSYKFADPLYMPPEQCQGQQLDERSDIYSLGCILYQALTGKLPFGSKKGIQLALAHLCDPPRTFSRAMFNCDIPEDVERVVMKCLEKDPKRRYKSVASLQHDLRLLLQSKKPKASSFPPSKPSSFPTSKPSSVTSSKPSSITPSKTSATTPSKPSSFPASSYKKPQHEPEGNPYSVGKQKTYPASTAYSHPEPDEPSYDFKVESKIRKSVLIGAAIAFTMISLVLLLPIADKLKLFPSSEQAPNSVPLSDIKHISEDDLTRAIHSEGVQIQALSTNKLTPPSVTDNSSSIDTNELFLYPRPPKAASQIKPQLSMKEQNLISELSKRTFQSPMFSAASEISYKELAEAYINSNDWESALGALQRLNHIQKHNGKNNIWTLTKLVEASYNTYNDGVVSMYADDAMNRLQALQAGSSTDNQAVQKAALISAGLSLQEFRYTNAEAILQKFSSSKHATNQFLNLQAETVAAYASSRETYPRGNISGLVLAVNKLQSFNQPEQILFRAKAEYALATVYDETTSDTRALRHISERRNLISTK